MGDNSKIEWTDATWNPIRARRTVQIGVELVERTGWHCEHVSEACRNCYAETFNLRGLGTGLAYKPGNRGLVNIFLDERVLQTPLRWRRPRKIFVCSMTDLFADFVSDETIDRIFAIMALCPQHTFQVLTKRPERMRRYLDRAGLSTRPEIVAAEIGFIVDKLVDPLNRRSDDLRATAPDLQECWPLPNVHLGTSTGTRMDLANFAGHLRLTPAAKRFLSIEPLLEDLGRVVLDEIDWVIVGGESGRNARPMHPDWVRSIRDQCAVAGVPFFFKQWGEWLLKSLVDPNARALRDFEQRTLDEETSGPFLRVGKKAAGRLLDGVEHNGMPA